MWGRLALRELRVKGGGSLRGELALAAEGVLWPLSCGLPPTLSQPPPSPLAFPLWPQVPQPCKHLGDPLPFLFKTELSLSPSSQDVCPHLRFPATKGCCQGCTSLLLDAPFPHLSLTLEAAGRAGVQGGWTASRGQHMTGFQPANLEGLRQSQSWKVGPKAMGSPHFRPAPAWASQQGLALGLGTT